ncbi:FecR family protein [Olivibacter ginsenosidimutans]
MARPTNKAKKLLRKYKNGQCTEEEKALLEQWYLQWNTDEKPLREEVLCAAENDMWQAIQKQKKNKLQMGVQARWIAAACIGLFVAFIGYRFFISAYKSTNVQSQEIVQDVNPGTNKALLTLTDGKKVDLDSLVAGQSITQAGLKISKDANGQLIYEAIKLAKDKIDHSSVNSLYNEVSTPQGGTFQLILPDGTKVWLNASSSIRYPLTFAAKERKVEMTGEAYFEVARQKTHQPFVVYALNQKVEVLGTHFNINAYENEGITTTTLIEGKVKVSATTGDSQVLKPNEQSVVKNYGHQVLVQEVNPEAAIAWKNGQFVFDNTDLKTIMRQLERWYNIDVVGLEQFPNNTYNGKLTREAKLSKVLQILELTSDLKFRIEAPLSNGQERRLILIR